MEYRECRIMNVECRIMNEVKIPQLTNVNITLYKIESCKPGTKD